MYSKEEAYQKIAELVERFSDQVDNYKRDYNETQTRQDFINPFFEALGWDMNNRQGAWEAYREVIHEDKLKVGGVTTAPDYSFRLVGGQRLFFVEAKKPSIIIKDDVAPAYQVRLYGWNAKLAISVVTDFEEFAVYECSKKPLKTDKASKARVNYYTYKDYLKEFDFFWNTFSKQQVIKGGLIKFQQSDKKGTATVDKDFLESLDIWRKELAANIYKNNEGISEDELNYAVQQTIDRIIFLRIAEDRGLEPYGQLKSSLQNSEQYKELYRQFRIADDKYNSGLFHFKKEKDNSKEPDNISGKLIIENKVIKSIISSLYPPQSEFLFNVMPVEILGSAYEQFLGKQIIVKGSRATIEEKPEVRKAGGVYYTPQYIVEYIVENTVGKLCKDKTPKEISKLKIVDPACGSGSFLLGAYQYLLQWHSKYYTSNPQTGKQKDAVLTPDGSLTTAEKKRILLNNIYGVDIDRNATEVTKLSLLLKCMEGETTASVNTQMTFFHERILPSLENNIKSGNSLIDVDFYDTEFDFGEEKKIRPFNWQQGFPEVFKQGGFDVVIGNPPYIRVQLLNQSKENLNYYADNYKAAIKGNYDIYVLFIERALNILNNNGLIGFILPHKFFNSKYGHEIRDIISKGEHLNEIIHFGDKQIFYGATTYTCLLFLNKRPTKRLLFSQVEDLENWKINKIAKSGYITSKSLNSNEWNLSTGKEQLLFLKLNSILIKLGDISKIFVGLQTSADTVFLFKESYKSSKNVITVFSKELNDFIEIESKLLKEVVRSGEIGRYWINTSALVLFPYHLKNGDATLISESELKSAFPFAWNYLSRNKKLLENRESGKFKNTGWYQLYPKNLEMWEENKIMLPYMIKNLSAYYDTSDKYFVNVTTGGFGLRVIKKEFNSLFITGLLNSKVLDWYLKKVSTNFNSGYFAANKQFLVQLPIAFEKPLNDEIVHMVETMLQLNKEKQQTTTPDKLEQLNTRIQYTDDKINKLVYQLYGLSEEEIGVIELKAANAK